MDWNSFFSTLSQSAAGLIAIIAAFVISKLLGENEKLEKLSGEMDEYIILYNNILSKISVRYFNWHDKMTIKHSSGISKAVQGGEFDELSEEERYVKLKEIDASLYGTEDCLIELNKLIEKNISSGFGLNAISLISPTNLWTNLSEEREAITSLKIESKTMIDKFTKLKRDVHSSEKNLKPFRTTIYILILAFLLTVIYPLHFMPMKINELPNLSFDFLEIIQLLFSLKGFFLLMLTLTVIIIFGYFIVILSNLEKRYRTLGSAIDRGYIDIKSYSVYFS